jgi:hypothetical protein
MAHPSTTWANPKALELLQDCLAKRMSSGQTAKVISAKLGVKVSRNAVIGRVFRAGGSFNSVKADDELKRQRATRKRQEEAERMRVKRALEYAVRDAAKQTELATMVEPKPCGDGERGCRWPSWGFDDRPSRLFCGAQRRGLSSYCTFHFHVCHRVVSEGQAKKIIEAAAA